MLSPKFLKNRETLIFQKLAGGDKSPPYQVAFKISPFESNLVLISASFFCEGHDFFVLSGINF